jgi:ADP-ribose pyrophosphatase YjhB (NUDIX family)
MAKLLFGVRIGRMGSVLLGCSATIIAPDGSLLLTKRRDNGRWCLPGGRLESGESVEEACQREVLEETGLVIRVVRLVGVYSDPHQLVVYPDGNQFHVVSLNFDAVVEGGTLKSTTPEVTEALFHRPDQLHQIDLMENHRIRIQDALVRSPSAFIR